uniref:VQ domain-containing protein n=1 Tax=Ananas comosus var. bracteatus TaxID=296719 RepID=A0A6V7QWJ1_ANACO
MDSTTSGSVQSSSGGGGGGGSRGGGGGDEEYTSQPDFLSSFLTLPPPTPPSSSTSHLLHHHHHHHHPSPSFDSFSTFLDPLPHSLPQNPSPPSTNPFPIPPHLPNPSCTTSAASSGQHPVQPDRSAAPGPARASKKRPRASRRPPTTVLTTDTSNFRAMVQEFTGFPAPPFSSSFARPRLDLFQSPYLLRPFAQKNHASTFAPINSSSSGSTASTMVDAIASIARNSLVNLNTLLASTSATSASVPIDLQHPNLPSFALQSQPTIPKEFAVGDLGSFVGSESLIKPAHRTSNSLSIWADGLGLDGGDRDPLIGSESAAAKRSTDVDKGRR